MLEFKGVWIRLLGRTAKHQGFEYAWDQDDLVYRFASWYDLA